MNLVAFVVLLFVPYMKSFLQVGALRQPLASKGQSFRYTALRTFARRSAAERNVVPKTKLTDKTLSMTLKAPADRSSENDTETRAQAENDLEKLMQKAFSEAELVTVTNSQKSVPIDTDEVSRQAQLLMNILKVQDFELDILFCSETKIQSLNSEWREKSESTDVLSFPTHNFVAPEKFDAEARRMFRFQKHLGELVIAPEFVQRQCDVDKKDYEEMMRTEEGRREFQEEIDSDNGVNRVMATVFTQRERTPLLLIHGLLHLLGYDHETDDEWQAMTDKENEVMKDFNAQWEKVHVL